MFYVKFEMDLVNVNKIIYNNDIDDKQRKISIKKAPWRLRKQADYLLKQIFISKLINQILSLIDIDYVYLFF